jgi:hypothetical protein
VWFKHRAWVPVAWLLCLANIVSVGFAAGEPLHATAHAVLAVLLGLGAERLRLRNKHIAEDDVVEVSRELESRPADQGQLQDVEGRLAELEDRLDFTERVLVDVRKRAQPPPKE